MKFISKFFESSNFLFIRFFCISILNSQFSILNCFAQPNTWVAVYGGYNYDRGKGICQTYDKGYIVCGPTSSYGMGNTDFYLLKINSDGKYLWQNTFGGINIENAFSVQQTSDSGFVICGYTNSLGSGGYDAYLVKTDSMGNFQWQKSYGGSDWDFAYWAEQTTDGGYILAGETFSYGNNTQAYLVKIKSNGDTLWTKKFGGTNADVCYEVHQTTDGGFVLAGYTTVITGDKDFYLIKTDSDGNKEWEKAYGTSTDDDCNSVALCADGGFLLGGYATIGTERKNYLMKTNDSGNITSSKIDTPLIGNREIFFIRENKEGDYYMVGWTDNTGLGAREIFFAKWNTGFWQLAGGSLGGQDDDEGYQILQSSDSGYVMVGYTGSFGQGTDNIIIFKTDKNMLYNNTVNTYVSVNEISDEDNSEIMVYPNPSSGKFRISGFRIQDSKIKIYNLMGSTIFESKNISQNSEINIASSPEGIYLVEIIFKEGVARKKIILSK